ncbi:MAG TPA: DUF917 domain-containing protein [Bacillota bacterium]|nr:DUF917 domain-containing protein [Bacillota bacterium]
MNELTQQDIEHITLGAAVLGTGGGGDPYIGKLMAKHAIEKHGPVQVITMDDLDDEDLVVPISMIGAPSVMAEKIPAINGAKTALEAIEKALNKKATAVMPIEIGGVNSLIPILVAAKKGIPILDADAMGRAFPEAQMVTFHLDGLKPEIVSMSDERENTIIFHPINGEWSEKLARAITIQMGGSATMCDYALPGKTVKKSAIPKTLSLAAEIGKILSKQYAEEGAAVKQMLERLNGYHLITGKITHIERKIQGGFTKGHLHIEGIDEYTNKNIELYFQNEQLLATENDKPLAITPDLIAILDKETGHPITTEALKYGERVIVVAFPCHEKWRTKEGIKTAGPKYFGYDAIYQPIEELQQNGVDHT